MANVNTEDTTANTQPPTTPTTVSTPPDWINPDEGEVPGAPPPPNWSPWQNPDQPVVNVEPAPGATEPAPATSPPSETPAPESNQPATPPGGHEVVEKESDLAVDPETGKVYDVTDPSKPVEVKNPNPYYIENEKGEFVVNPNLTDEERQQFLDTAGLKDYTVVTEDGQTTYNLTQYLIDNPDESQSLVKLGFSQDAVNAAKTNAQQIQSDFAANNHILPDGKGIPKDQWDKLPDEYKTIADKEGFTALLSRMQSDQQTYSDAMGKLQKAGVVNAEGNIDIAEYLRKNPDDTETVYKVIGKNDETIKAVADAKQYNDRPVAVNTFNRQWFNDHADEMRAMGLELAPDNTPLLPDINDPERNAKLAAFQNVMDTVTKEYKQKYGQGAFYGSIVATPLSFVFSPARAIAPDVTIKDISGMEWAVGTAQLADRDFAKDSN